MDDSVTLRDVYQARRTIAPWVQRTPLISSSELSRRTGASVLLKLETVHDIGAFKIRGATNRIMHLSEDERRRGVVAVSTGNHGRAVAYAAKRVGVHATVFMSKLVKENKLRAIKDLGAEIRIVGDSQDEAEVEADRLAAEQGMISVHPFDHPHVIAGQGVIGLELLEDLPKIDCLLAGLSGGGLISGIALTLKAANPSIRVIGVSMERGPAMYHSLRAGKPVLVEETETLADSLGGGIGLNNQYTFSLVSKYVDETLLVSEEEIAQAMTYLYWNERLVVEGGGAVGVAALLCGRTTGIKGNVVCVLSGSNVDMTTFSKIVHDNG
ncbi:MAG: hydroxyectoine utilization dehydratase EutB [Gammaproteobacteria bacterium]|nr:hydroxyectoine utilization dehydratase EutB [Gammaproteobacteria bacterium]